MSQEAKPTEQRQQERKQEKAQGRDRRAEILLDAKAKEAARADVIEARVGEIERRLGEVERRLALVERAAPPAPASQPHPTPAPASQQSLPHTNP